MPNIKSAIKRVDVINKKTNENRMIKSKVATLSKNIKTLVAEGKIEEAEQQLPEVIAYIDSAANKNVIHANCAARKVSNLQMLVNNAKKA